MKERFRIAVLGLTVTSSWGNGHATTFRALLRGLAALGHDVIFLERDVPWYAASRDLRAPDGYQVTLYESLAELDSRCRELVRDADAVIVGSYVPDGAEVLAWVQSHARGLRLFYDIDTPVTLAKLASGDESYLARASIPALDAYLSFSGGPVLALIEREFGARLALPLYCSVDARRYIPVDRRPELELGYLGTYSADRQPALERLLIEPARRLPERRFVVAGACYPAEADWPPNVERDEHVPPGRHPAFYGSLRFTLNVTRADMKRLGFSPSVRLFEAAACGCPIISDRWPGIERFFEPGSEILLADDAEQVLEILRGFDDAARLRLARRARQRVLAEHTAAHRALELEGYLRELGAGRHTALRERRSQDSVTASVR